MKRMTRRVRALNERATELTAAAAQLPQRVAELRQTAVATTNELQSLKSGIQNNIPDLLVKREDELSAALAEVAAHAPVFAEAGFILDGLDLEISPLQQIIVQLLHHREVETLAIQPLIQRHQQQKSVRAILSAIVKAKAVVSTIEIDGLDYEKLTIAIGPVPTIRLCWRERATETETDASPTRSPARPEGKDSRPSFFGTPPPLPPRTSVSSSTKEADSPALPATTAPLPKASPASPAPELPKEPNLPNSTPKKEVSIDPQDPLARFKVMPSFDRR